MTDYTELIRSLRNCSNNRCTPCDCGWFNKYQVDESCKEIIMWKAAAAIEALQAEVNEAMRHNTDLLNMKEMTKEEEDEILEYIRTIPVGPLEPMLIEQLPKRGEWVEDTTTHAGPGLSNYKCSLCGKICGTWRSGLKPSELPNWCGNCGADMRKMEVQE